MPQWQDGIKNNYIYLFNKVSPYLHF